ncbi:NOL1/NOP2/sun family protein [Plectosphaerella cucumerina]|uniref:NOL1/NOP2/sun family protein n=1 Tax=Plectosphaerella cucumerina TaxID=40658 RepID=A0A8K0T8S3_9PEZI|nr:NOL1/NOP2/sun family protein [Plectosphaerella cucumerina]
MGRGRKRHFNKGNRGGAQRTESWTSYAETEKKHEKLQNYYDTLLQLPDEEKELFWNTLRRELPNSFRFAGSKGHAILVRNLLKDRYMPEIVKIEHADGRTVEPPQPVPWYPNELAWSMTTPKNIVRKFAPFSAFQKFLVSETSIGNISRQEVVSMIPPLVMDVRPGMTVLDMCASPGSKATQLLEMIHRGEEARIRKVLRAHAQEDGLDLGLETQEDRDADLDADPTDDGRATGLLIANDTDYKRCHMLVHQLKRLSSPNMIVTNHDATMFPSIRLPSLPETPNKPRYMKFDRILADVPCSGDGTMRKNMNLWQDWNPNSALGLHNTQIRILVRALTMLKPGGRVVYSTCSMNPVENEAVVGAAIDRCGGPDKVEIVDCANELVGLKRRPGLKNWSVMDKSGRIWNNMKEVNEYLEGKDASNLPGKLVETMFPLPEECESSKLPFERCMRVYAHLQDTGGFFITVLHKKAEVRIRSENGAAKSASADEEDEVKEEAIKEEAIKEEPVKEDAPKVEEPVKAEPVKEEDVKKETDAEVKTESDAQPMDLDDASSTGTKRPREDEAPADQQDAKKLKVEDADDSTPQPQQVNTKPARNRHGQVEEPFKFLPPTHEVLQNIKQFYSLSSRFPQDRFMIRNATGDPAKAIYYTSQLVKDVLEENEGRAVKFVHGGVKMFMKQDVPAPDVCRWRIQSEGLPIVQGYVGEDRVVHLYKKETLRRLLIQMFYKINDGAWETLGEIGERVRDIGMGCCVLRVEPDGTPDGFEERMAIPLWKSIHSLNLMLPKEDRSAMLLRIFNDTTPLVNNALTKEKQIRADAEKKKREEAAAGEGAAEGTAAAESTAEAVDLDALEDAPSPASD